jgi:hypothetical protein
MQSKSRIVIIAALALLIGGIGYSLKGQKTETPEPPKTEATVLSASSDTVTYQGQKGKDALSRLKETAQVEQDASGLVVSINGRKADSAAKEYWGFYVNGQMAPVGPADYQTQDTDKIEWKIEKF